IGLRRSCAAADINASVSITPDSRATCESLPPWKLRTKTVAPTLGGLCQLCSGQRARAVVLLKQSAPCRVGQPALKDLAIASRPAVVVVVDLGPQNEQVDQWDAHQDVLHRLQRTEPNDVADPTGAVVTDPKIPGLVGHIAIAHQFDLASVPDA